MTPADFEDRVYEILRRRDPLWLSASARNPESGAYIVRGQLSRDETNLLDALGALYREATAVSLEDYKAALDRVR